MKTSDLLSLSTRMFKTRPMRTFLTILGVGVGIGAVLFLVSLGYGLQNLILNRITSADALLSLDVTPATANVIALNEKSLAEISALPEVAEISPQANFSSQLSYGELTVDGSLYAVNSSFFRLSGLQVKLGSFFTRPEVKEAVISTTMAKLLNLSPADALNKEVNLVLFMPKTDGEDEEILEPIRRPDRYKIVGVVEDEATGYIFVPLNTLADLKIDNYAAVKVKVSDSAKMGAARDSIINKGFLASALSDTIEQARKIFRIIQIVLALFGLVALAVSAIGMFNTMTITLLERINEIGIMRSIGASSRDIFSLFVIESVVMGFLGGVGGLVIGYLAGELFNLFVNILARSFGGQVMDLFFRPLWFILVILVFSTTIGFLTGIYPARRASKLNPLEALRYK